MGVWLVVLGGMGSAKAQDTVDLKALNDQVYDLFQQGRCREAIPLAKQALVAGEKIRGSESLYTAICLNNLSELYGAVNEYTNAEPLLQRALEIVKQVSGPESADAAMCLNNLGGLYKKMGNYSRAETYDRNALDIYEKTRGPVHPDTAFALNDLAGVYCEMGNYTNAQPLYERALKIREITLGPTNSDTATSLNNLAELYRDLGEYTNALSLMQRALNIRENVLGPNHPDTAGSLNSLASLYSDLDEYTNAEALYQRALKIKEARFGVDQLETAVNLNNLAEVYRKMAEYTNAEPLYARALKITEKALGTNHADTASVYNNIAELYRQMGRWAEAEQFFQRALKINETVLGTENPTTATTLDNLAAVYTDSGDYARAEPLSLRALTIRQNILGSNHLDTAMSLNNLGGICTHLGNYAKAEELFQRSLQIREDKFGPDSPQASTSLNNLAGLYKNMGDYAQAESFYERALKICEKTFGPEHPATALSLNNLAELYWAMGNYAKAGPLYQRAFDINEKKLGPNHPDTATVLGNLAEVHAQMDDYAKAEALFQQVLKIQEIAVGPNHPATAITLNNLADLYAEQGSFAKAEPLLLRALTIREKSLGTNHVDTARTLNDLAEVCKKMNEPARAEPLFIQALNIKLHILGPDNPSTAIAFDDLAGFYLDAHRLDQARDMATRGAQAHEKVLANVLAFASQQQRLDFQQTLSPYWLFGTLGDGPSLLHALLHNKGVVLDSLLEDHQVARASSDPRQAAAVRQLSSARQQLACLSMEVPKDFSETALAQRAQEKADLGRQIDALEDGLARQVSGLGKARRALSVTVGQVQAALSTNQALVEIVCYDYYHGTNDWEAHYGAVVMGFSGEPVWVPLGTAAAIESTVSQYQKEVRGQPEDDEFAQILQALYQQVWAPIQRVLPTNTSTVIICPDGDLNFVSFATLLMPDHRFLGERYALGYVASGRDLVQTSVQTSNRLVQIYADPDYFMEAGTNVPDKLSNTSLLATRSVAAQDLQSVYFKPLSGTAREGESLAGLTAKWGWTTELNAGTNATKARLETVASPYILHLATHGFFLPETKVPHVEAAGMKTGAPGRPQTVFLKDPMERSGLALAAAQVTINAWKRGEVPPADNDGIVTAEDVGGLQLAGTWLVTLSACDSGSGQSLSGEGVMGLRRGFIQAGAQNLLMTLWNVPDRETADFMVDFYTAAHGSGNAPAALAAVQRDWLKQVRQEAGLVRAVQTAGPFILSTKGQFR